MRVLRFLRPEKFVFAEEYVIFLFSTIFQADLGGIRSEEHTSELQSLAYLVCRLLLEKKKTYAPIACPHPCNPVITVPRMHGPSARKENSPLQVCMDVQCGREDFRLSRPCGAG